MRVMTYNMLHAPGDRLDALVAVIRSAQPDVLACQEVDDIPGLLEISRRLEMPVVFGYANTEESPPSPEHLALLSRWPITEVRTHRGDREVMFRPILEAWVEPPESAPVGFFTLHFRASPGAPHSQAKIREVRSLCEVLTQATGRFCVLGDFNALAPGEGDHLRELRPDMPADYLDAVGGGVISHLQALGLTDTWRTCHLAPEPVPSTLRSSKLPRVDYIWASPALAPFVKESAVLRASETEEASDHYPVLTVFEGAGSSP